MAGKTRFMSSGNPDYTKKIDIAYQSLTTMDIFADDGDKYQAQFFARVAAGDLTLLHDVQAHATFKGLSMVAYNGGAFNTWRQDSLTYVIDGEELGTFPFYYLFWFASGREADFQPFITEYNETDNRIALTVKPGWSFSERLQIYYQSNLGGNPMVNSLIHLGIKRT